MKELLDTVLERMRHGHHTQMADVSSLNLLRQMFEQSHTAKRMDAQVDAMYRCKYGDDYEIPEREDPDDMQVIMNSVITDRKTLSKVAGGAENEKKSMLPWLLGSIATGILGAGLTAYLLRGSDTDTQNTLRPSNPSQLLDFTKDS